MMNALFALSSQQHFIFVAVCGPPTLCLRSPSIFHCSLQFWDPRFSWWFLIGLFYISQHTFDVQLSKQTLTMPKRVRGMLCLSYHHRLSDCNLLKFPRLCSTKKLVVLHSVVTSRVVSAYMSSLWHPFMGIFPVTRPLMLAFWEWIFKYFPSCCNMFIMQLLLLFVCKCCNIFIMRNFHIKQDQKST